jgi:hypothetical protein
LLQLRTLLASSTTKKAIIRRFHRETLAGYLNPVTFLQDGGVELLSTDGQISVVPYEEIKTVSFVREFDPELQERQVFQTRPKMAGLWVRFRFRDGEVMEGILPNNLLQIEHHGLAVVPPDPHGNRHWVFVPRAAVLAAEVLGVVSGPLKRRKAQPVPADQIGLFDEQ